MRDLEPTGKASQLIARLQALIAEHGDLPVYLDDPDTNWLMPIGCEKFFGTEYYGRQDVQVICITSCYSGRPDGDLLEKTNA